MPDDNVRKLQPATDEDEERVFQLVGELETIKKRLLDPKTKPKDYEQLIQFIGRSMLPLMIQTAHYTKENTSAIYDLADMVEQPPGTQFTPEDAKTFDFVLSCALEMVSLSLTDPMVQVGSDAHQKFIEIRDKATYCLGVVRDNTVGADNEDDPAADDETDDGEGE